MNRLKRAILATLMMLDATSFAAEENQQTLLIHAGNLLAVPGEAPVRQQSIIVRGSRIDAVVDGYVDPASLAGDVRLLDLSDQFVLPGLIDSHVHLLSEITPQSRNDALYITTSMEAMRGVYYAGITLDSGFTTVRDLGAEPEAIYALRESTRALLTGRRSSLPAVRWLQLAGTGMWMVINLNCWNYGPQRRYVMVLSSAVRLRDRQSSSVQTG